MSQPNTLMELGEMYPNETNFYTKLKENRENYLNDLKKLYNNILQVNFSIMCLKLRMGTILENTRGMELMLDYDTSQLQEENEAQTVNAEE